jgi:hypothetical protein
MSMTMAEGRSECKRLFDECAEILGRYGGRITEDTPNDERKKIDDNMAEINGLEIKLGRLKLDDEDADRIARGVRDYGAPADPAPGGFEHRAVSLGRYVTGRPEYRSSIQPGGALTGQRPYLAVATPPELSLVDLAIRTARGRKALITSGATSGGAISINDRLPGSPAWRSPGPTSSTSCRRSRPPPTSSSGSSRPRAPTARPRSRRRPRPPAPAGSSRNPRSPSPCRTSRSRRSRPGFRSPPARSRTRRCCARRSTTSCST